MNILFKPIFLKFSAMLLGLISIFTVSGGEDYDYWYKDQTTFTPEVFVTDKSYEPLLYTSSYFYGENQFLEGHSNRFVDDQVNEWNTYLNNKISKTKLKLIIGTDSLNKVISKCCYAINTNFNEFSNKNFDIKDPKTKEFLLYINLAKSLEKSTNWYPDWSYESDTYQRRPLIKISNVKKIEKTYNIITDPFLKHKYWFLTLKSYFYSENNNSTIEFFNKTESSIAKTTSYYRGLSYVAGIHRELGQFSLSNYKFSVVFENCPKLRQEAVFNFKPKQTEDFKGALALAKTNTDKAAVWALYGYYADPVEAISNIYNIDPKNKHLDYLLSRAINIEESKLNKSEYQRYTYINITENEKLDNVLYNLIIKIANNKNTANLYSWFTAAGYLETLKGNYDKATNYLNEATNSTKSSLVLNQIKLFTVYNEVSKVKKLNKETENTLLPHLEWLFDFNKKKQEEINKFYEGNNAIISVETKLRTEFLTNWVRTYMANIYNKQNDVVQSEMFSRQRSFYLNEERVNKMQTYFEDNEFKKWDRFIQSIYKVTIDDIHEFKGIKLAYNDQIDEAISEFRKSNRTGEPLYGNPFNGKIKDCNDCDHSAKQSTKYTKLSFLMKIKEIKDNIAKGVESFSGNILLGNAHYNMSHYGNARYFYENEIIDQYGNYLEEEYDDMLSNDKFVTIYYQKALKLAVNNEEKAKATYLLTKIERNKFYLSDKYKPNEVDYIVFDGYKKLIKNYADTQYYQDVIRECGYFRTIATN
jgi:hypothetical protein